MSLVLSGPRGVARFTTTVDFSRGYFAQELSFEVIHMEELIASWAVGDRGSSRVQNSA